MTKLRVHAFAISLDGYGAGPGQDLENPLGAGGLALHEWSFATRTFRQMCGEEGGSTGTDDEFAARGGDIWLGGGVSTIRQYLQARLIDEMHLAIAPVLLGSGEHLLAGLNLPALGYQCTEHIPTPGATHVVLTKRSR